MSESPSGLHEISYLLDPGAVLMPDGTISGGGVVVTDGVFTAIGPIEQLVADHPQIPVVPMPGHLLMPGFVDAHHHLSQSFGTSLAFGEPSEIFRRVWVPLENALDDHTAYISAKLASLEALRGGFTTVTDAGTRAPVDLGVIAAGANDTGVRCVLGLVCNDLEPGRPTPHEILGRAEKHLAHYAGDRLTHASLAVSIPEAASDKTFQGVASLAEDAGAVLQVHVNEHLASVERSLITHGLRPLEYLDSLGVLGPWFLGAHATLITSQEMQRVRDSGAALSYNPVASAWKGNAVAPALALAELGVRLGLGTDGTRGDGFRLMDAAEFAQRLAYGLSAGDSSCGAGWRWLDLATRGSADAVGLGAVTGQIAEGMAADFLLVDTQVPELSPSWDLPWELVRLGNRDQITAVVVGGRLRLWEGWPTAWDGRQLLEEATEMGRKVVASAPIRRTHPTSSEHRASLGRPR